MDERITFPSHPNLTRGLSKFLSWLPWCLVILMIVLRIRKGPRVHAGYYALGTFLPNILLVGFILFNAPVENFVNQEPFDPVRWKTAQDSQDDFMWPARLKMIDNLMESQRLDSLNRAEVESLLGPPDGTRHPKGKSVSEIYYLLGPERGFIRIDSEWLSISFDGDGKVLRYWTWRD